MRPVIRTRFGRRAVPREVEDELAFHLEMRARQLMESGLTHEAAIEEARRRFGDVGEVRNTCVTYDEERLRSMNRLSIVHDIRQDLAYAVRMIRRAPAVSMIVILTLALGIGANTAIFSLINAVMLRSLPVERPSEIVRVSVHEAGPIKDGDTGNAYFTNPLWEELRDHADGFSGFAASGSMEFDLAEFFPTEIVG